MTRPRLATHRCRTAQLTLAVLGSVAPLPGCAPGGDTAGSGPSTTATTATSAGPSSSGSVPAATTSPPSSDAGAVRLSVSVKDGDVSPPPRRVELNKGDRVRLRVTSDIADEVHVHGVDKSKDVARGNPTVLTFVVEQTGLFEVELENEGLQLLQLEVR